MIDINSGLKGVADKEKWAARGASFVTKVKATKAVWFPPKPVETGKGAASAATKVTKRATRKATGDARKRTAGATKKTSGATKKTTGTTRKAADGVKKVTNPVRRKKA